MVPEPTRTAVSGLKEGGLARGEQCLCNREPRCVVKSATASIEIVRDKKC
jgi:hypothetical protein